MNLAVRTTPPVLLSSLTSAVVRELRTSTVRPARVASIRYSRAAPAPASTKTSTKSPFAMPLLFPIHGELKLKRRFLSVAQPPPRPTDLQELREAAASCQGCDLWREATQTVFGEGPERAQLLLI